MTLMVQESVTAALSGRTDSEPKQSRKKRPELQNKAHERGDADLHMTFVFVTALITLLFIDVLLRRNWDLSAELVGVDHLHSELFKSNKRPLKMCIK